MSCKWPLVKIDDIKDPAKYSCVGGPFGSSLSRKHYIETEGVPVLRGVNLGRDQFFDGDFVYVSEQKATELHRNIAYPNDVVFTQRGTLGQVAIIPQKPRYSSYVVSQSQMKLTVNSEITDPYYVYSYFRTEQAKQQIETHAIVGGVPHINLGILKNLEIPFPPLSIQKYIVNIIRSLDEKIILNTQTNQTLEQMAQAIFKSWFVDFDPVKAKMNGEQPVGMDDATAALFPDKLVESELGLIPEGWEASSIGEHFNITMGQSPKGETYNEDGEGIAFFQGRRDFGFRYPDVRVYTTDPKRHAKAGDTLISVRAPVGDKNMAAIDCCIGRGVAAIKHKSQSRSFTYAFVSHIEKKLGDSGSSGTVFSSINQNELKKVSFVAPPQELIEAFHKFVDPIDQKIEALSGEIKSLSAMRDTLLPKLLSGEIALGQVQELAEAST